MPEAKDGREDSEYSGFLSNASPELRDTRGDRTMKLKDGFDSNYRYVLVAARRARQLSGGAPPLVTTNARKVCKIAQEEIDAGKVQYVKPEKAAQAAGKTEEKK